MGAQAFETRRVTANHPSVGSPTLINHPELRRHYVEPLRRPFADYTSPPCSRTIDVFGLDRHVRQPPY